MSWHNKQKFYIRENDDNDGNDDDDVTMKTMTKSAMTMTT